MHQPHQVTFLVCIYKYTWQNKIILILILCVPQARVSFRVLVVHAGAQRLQDSSAGEVL